MGVCKDGPGELLTEFPPSIQLHVRPQVYAGHDTAFRNEVWCVWGPRGGAGDRGSTEHVYETFV